jgi:protein ImuB
VDRLACVDVPALPLQLLLRRHPEWTGWPAAVVDSDKPQGRVMWANALAREAGVLPGARYAGALSLAPTLRAGTVSAEVIRAGVDELFERLHGFSPDIEPAIDEPGVFWVDAAGLGPVFPSLDAWAAGLRNDLAAHGYTAGVVVGFRRFGTYAVARAIAGRRVIVFGSPEEEEAQAAAVRLDRVGLSPAVRDALDQLGVRRVGEFAALPAVGVGKRFGPQALAVHRFATGAVDLPLAPRAVVEAISERLALDYGEENAERLVFILKPLVDALLASLAERGFALVELQLAFELSDETHHHDRVRTAEPTLQSVTVMELVKLRLAAGPLPAPVVGIVVTAEHVVATSDQLRLFAEAPPRDMAAAARAFARLRAAYGEEDVVVKAVMRDRHTPEGRWAWEPLLALPWPNARAGAAGRLVRRVLAKPEPLSGPPGRGPDGLRLVGGVQEQWTGPYRLSGGWWRSGGLERDYYFAELRTGELLWVYFDRVRARWFLQGEVV